MFLQDKKSRLQDWVMQQHRQRSRAGCMTTFIKGFVACWADIRCRCCPFLTLRFSNLISIVSNWVQFEGIIKLLKRKYFSWVLAKRSNLNVAIALIMQSLEMQLVWTSNTPICGREIFGCTGAKNQQRRSTKELHKANSCHSPPRRMYDSRDFWSARQISV